jgi:lincosamide nucleotidyltransferase A/C/D/E
LTGIGTIDGCAVRCIAPDGLVRFHTGKSLQEKDWADVSALCTLFGLQVPAEYRRFRQRR